MCSSHTGPRLGVRPSCMQSSLSQLSAMSCLDWVGSQHNPTLELNGKLLISTTDTRAHPTGASLLTRHAPNYEKGALIRCITMSPGLAPWSWDRYNSFSNWVIGFWKRKHSSGYTSMAEVPLSTKRKLNRSAHIIFVCIVSKCWIRNLLTRRISVQTVVGTVCI